MRVLSLLIAAAVAASTAAAWTFTLDNMRYPPYSHDGYRPMPHWRIGVFDSQSGPARFSTKDWDPSVELDVTLHKARRPFGYFFMYPINQVEGGIYADSPQAHPCMYAGQQSGVANVNNIGASLILTAQNNMGLNPDGSDQDFIRFYGRAPIVRTDLYAFTFLTCRYLWRNKQNPSEVIDYQPANESAYTREFDPGAENVTASGTVTVRNPYGHLPGQAYGFVPWYAIIFVVLFFNTLTLTIRMICVGKFAIIPHQWANVGMSALTLFVCIFFVAYVGEINEKNEDKSSVYITGYFFQRVRDAFARVFAGLFVLGYGITRQSLKGTEKAVAVAFFFIYILFGIIHILATETSGRRVLGLASIVRLDPGPMHIAVVILDLLLNATVVVFLIVVARRTLAEMEVKSTRRTLFMVTLVIIAIYSIFGFLVASAKVVSGELHDRPFEHQWKAWWLAASIMDGAFTAGVVAFTFVWFPREATTNLPNRSFTDNSQYGGGRQGVPERAPGSGFQQIGTQQVDYGDEGDSGAQEMSAVAPRPQGGAQPPRGTHYNV
eukprot:CAMPEP_0174827598 /NCGR_PEP_ID=MMETSP1114-20130205/825_1 /TAXON_ID=312471 /ORGANISM="Neobodo designis, Strain CCAP 1951/1" /LENGTH=548 /DNA_ID=CAMNT_0016061267 /DNA_START=103 /DNA_END=1749 /DNA_ORIENTATION=+